MLDALLTFPEESSQFIARGLRILSSREDVAQGFELVLANLARSGSARVVGKPVGIPGEDQMGRENDATRCAGVSAKGQARWERGSIVRRAVSVSRVHQEGPSNSSPFADFSATLIVPVARTRSSVA